MIKITHPNKVVKGSVTLPSSKSLSNRALIIQALCGDGIQIKNLSEAEDTQILQKILNENPAIVDIGDAGTAMRFLTAYYSIQEKETTLTGSTRMLQRPIGPLVDALRSMGVGIEYLGNEGYPPLKISGNKKLKNTVTIRSDVSSQYISALMMIAPVIEGGLEIVLDGEPLSYEYIEMTHTLMEYFGAEVELTETGFIIAGTGYNGGDYEVEPDWSAASYFFEAAALTKFVNVTLEDLSYMSSQGDSGIADLFYSVFSVAANHTEKGVKLTKEKPWGIDEAEYDFTGMPDMAQTIAVAAAGLKLPFKLTGLQTLRIKETDRIEALKTELQKLNVVVETGADWLELKSFGELPKSITFNTYNDHRMAMALTPLALVIDEVILDDETVVKKSFPGYWEELKKLGFAIEVLGARF